MNMARPRSPQIARHSQLVTINFSIIQFASVSPTSKSEPKVSSLFNRNHHFNRSLYPFGHHLRDHHHLIICTQKVFPNSILHMGITIHTLLLFSHAILSTHLWILTNSVTHWTLPPTQHKPPPRSHPPAAPADKNPHPIELDHHHHVFVTMNSGEPTYHTDW